MYECELYVLYVCLIVTNKKERDEREENKCSGDFTGKIRMMCGWVGSGVRWVFSRFDRRLNARFDLVHVCVWCGHGWSRNIYRTERWWTLIIYIYM